MPEKLIGGEKEAKINKPVGSNIIDRNNLYVINGGRNELIWKLLCDLIGYTYL